MPRITVPLLLDTKVVLEQLHVGPEQLVELFRRPDVKCALLLDGAVFRGERVRVLGTVEPALGAREVVGDVGDDVLRH